MTRKSILAIIASSFAMSNVLAIEPVYEGEDGILAKVFTSNCIACHSTDNVGAARNNAPVDVNFNNYAVASTNGNKAVQRGVTLMNMPPSFSQKPRLDNEQKQALKNWQALGFPQHSLPAIFSFDSSVLQLPKVYLKDDNGDIIQKIFVEMTLLPSPQGIQFEVTDFHDIEESEGQEHVHQ